MAKIKNTLILGVSGMLGSMIFAYLSKNPNLQIAATARNLIIPDNETSLFRLDVSANIENQIQTIIHEFDPDYIINCIGIINRYCRDDDPAGIINAIRVNSLFPHLLNQVCKRINPATKIIQIATDCVFSGARGNYNEHDVHDASDVYGKSKSLGEVNDPGFLNIRSSIIGPEVFHRTNLMEWFLNHKKGTEINGYTHHIWNGVTTLQFAEYCENIIIHNSFENLRNLSPTHHFCPNKKVSKFELLGILQSVFQTDFIIQQDDHSVPATDKSLVSDLIAYEPEDMARCIAKLKQFLPDYRRIETYLKTFSTKSGFK